MRFQVAFAVSAAFSFAAHADALLPVLCSAKKRKQKKSDCACKVGFAKLLSIHAVFGQAKTRCFAAQAVLSLSTENRAPFGCAGRGWQHRLFVVTILFGRFIGYIEAA